MLMINIATARVWSASYKSNFPGELRKQRDGIFTREQPLGELCPPERGSHRDPESHQAIGRVPGQVGRARGDDHHLSGARGPFRAADTERSFAVEYLKAFLHLRVNVFGGTMPRASPRAVHHEHLRSANLELDLFTRDRKSTRLNSSHLVISY